MREDYIEMSMTASKYSNMMEHDKWLKEIPYIKFPSEWHIQVSPPFSGAVVRFRVKSGDAQVSVYLDCYETLGCFGEPYWEIYPHEGDIFRCAMNDIDVLIDAISESIQQQNQQKLES